MYQLKDGYAWATVQENIAALKRDGMPRSEAIPISYNHARWCFFRRHRSGLLPEWLAYPAGVRSAAGYDVVGRPENSPRSTNPVSPSQLAEAGRRYKDFSGHEPEEVDKVDLPGDGSRAAWVLGALDFVGYTTVRDGVVESYKHTFKKRSRPLLAVTHDGRHLLVVQGDYHVTERGIEDK